MADEARCDCGHWAANHRTFDPTLMTWVNECVFCGCMQYTAAAVATSTMSGDEDPQGGSDG